MTGMSTGPFQVPVFLQQSAIIASGNHINVKTHLDHQKTLGRIHYVLESHLAEAPEERPFQPSDASLNSAYFCLEHRIDAYFRRDPRSNWRVSEHNTVSTAENLLEHPHSKYPPCRPTSSAVTLQEPGTNKAGYLHDMLLSQYEPPRSHIVQDARGSSERVVCGIYRLFSRRQSSED